MDTEEKAEFILGILEEECKRANQRWYEMQLTMVNPIIFPNAEELLTAINIALEKLEVEEDA